MGHPHTRLTYEDYVLIPTDGKRHEIIDGCHFVSPAPLLYHQTVSLRLSAQMFEKIENGGRGRVFYAPVDVQLSKHDIVQPDLIVVLPEREHILREQNIQGAPDLLIEILSPSNQDHDRVQKRRLYERTGVPEYWLVDPTHRCVEQLVLQRATSSATDAFVSAGTHTESIPLSVLPDVSVDLTSVW